MAPHTKGLAAILSFPFRIYSEPVLPTIECEGSSDFRYRVYRPFRIRDKGTPLSPTVPIERWPGFEWNPSVPPDLRMNPPADLTTQPMGPRAHDAMRFDVYGDEAVVEKQLGIFAGRLLSWIRVLTGQPWIDEFEFQTDPTIKNTFPVDDEGRAVETPHAHGKVTTPDGNMRPLDAAIWQDAITRAATGDETPLRWLVFLDAYNARAQSKNDLAILHLSLSIEIARDSVLDVLVPPSAGASPFRGTNLLAHLSTDLFRWKGRDLETERPELWTALNSIYDARHHVAHGKPPIVVDRGEVRPVTEEDIRAWIGAARAILNWIEAMALDVAA